MLISAGVASPRLGAVVCGRGVWCVVGDVSLRDDVGKSSILFCPQSLCI